MGLQQEEWDISRLHPDPANLEIFDPIPTEQLEDLAWSIRRNGVIHPLTVRPDGTIIAGEQRWRAAQLLGFTKVPVIISDVSARQAEEIRIHENIFRRSNKPSEQTRAVVRLVEIMAEEDEKEDSSCTPRRNLGGAPGPLAGYLERLVTRLNVKERTVRTIYNRSRLIPELSELTDKALVTLQNAEVLSQLSPELQQELAKSFLRLIEESEENERKIRAEITQLTSQIKDLEKSKIDLEKSIKDLEKELEDIDEEGEEYKNSLVNERIAELQGKIEELTNEQDELLSTNESLRDDLEYAETLKKRDAIHKTLKDLHSYISLSPTTFVERVSGRLGTNTVAALEMEALERSIPWLQAILSEFKRVYGDTPVITAKSPRGKKPKKDESPVIQFPSAKQG